VVLGAAVEGGRPLPVFRARLDHAIALYRGGVAPHLVVTGGTSEEDRLAEAEVARGYAIRNGVPEEDILAETAGSDTLSSLRNVAQLFHLHGLRRGLFVSDRTHMLRVLRIARDLGLIAYGSPTPTSPADADLPARLDALLHELGALGQYFFLSPTQPAPAHARAFAVVPGARGVLTTRSRR
jgi:uncharacterized SAM-binding protein YcdF (DUF218 family)